MFLYFGAFGGLLCVLCALFFVRRLVSGHRHSDRLLNASAGIAVAYAFVDVFPHLARKQAVFDGFYSDSLLAYLSHHLYLVALIGFCVCIAARAAESGEARHPGRHFTHWLLSLLLCLYSLLLGYMLAEQPVHRPEPALLFGLAMGAHLLGLGHEVRDQAPRLYDSVIRYLLMASVAVGWVWGYLADFSERRVGDGI